MSFKLLTSQSVSLAKNEVLFKRIKKLVATERRIGLKVLECLHEIDMRRAYAELRYDGLFTYCVRELGFTDSQAYQRIQAMRALRDVPEIAPKIESGALSVSAVAKAQSHFRKERKAGKTVSSNEKVVLFGLLEGKTSREVDRTISEIRGEEFNEKLVLEMDPELALLWGRVKNLAAHRSRGVDSEVLKILAREWLERNDPLRKKREPKVAKKSAKPLERPKASPEFRRAVPWSTKVVRRQSRFISAAIRREVWQRDGGKCTRCHSRYALEVDHVLPFACGGKNMVENLRLVCHSCNHFLAQRTFGLRKTSRVQAAG